MAAERKICAIITRETDDGRHREHRWRCSEEFGDRFAEFIHILDPLEPGIVVGKSSAMAWGGRWLYRSWCGSGAWIPARSWSPTWMPTTGSTRSTSAT